MTTQISDEQRRAIQQHSGEPVYVVDPVAQKNYVLVPEDVYQRVRLIVGGQCSDVRELYSAQEQAFGEAGWNDPQMDLYNDYDAHRKTR